MADSSEVSLRLSMGDEVATEEMPSSSFRPSVCSRGSGAGRSGSSTLIIGAPVLGKSLPWTLSLFSSTFDAIVYGRAQDGLGRKVRER